MDSSYDIIAIGAGLAGSMAALNASQRGAKTLLLEKHERVGLPGCSAEGVTASGLERSIKPRPEWILSLEQGAPTPSYPARSQERRPGLSA